jgi:hypothetical protein
LTWELRALVSEIELPAGAIVAIILSSASTSASPSNISDDNRNVLASNIWKKCEKRNASSPLAFDFLIFC